NLDGNRVITSLTNFTNDLNSTNDYFGETVCNQTLSSSTQLDYTRSFRLDHHVYASLLGSGYFIQMARDANHEGSTYQPLRNTNLGIRAAYNYRHKYYLDFTGAMVHSAKLAPGNRNAFSPTFTLGWRISDEPFFRDNISFFDHL